MTQMNKEDHDLLIKVSTTLDLVHRNQINHLEHHRRRDLAMMAVTFGAVLSSILSIGTMIFTLFRGVH
jgi:hypothetical protein